MRVYRFDGRHDRTALTVDPTGTNLPDDFEPWQSKGVVELDRSSAPMLGTDADDIIHRIEEDGFFMVDLARWSGM